MQSQNKATQSLYVVESELIFSQEKIGFVKMVIELNSNIYSMHMFEIFSPLAARNFIADCPQTYDDFYQAHDIVWSGRFSIPLNPILQSDHPGHNIVARQKINLQCIVWFRTTKQIGNLSFGTAQLFTFESQEFESIELTKLLDHSEELLLYLRGYLQETLRECGIVIDVLSEAPRGYSLGFSGTFAGVLWHIIQYIKHGGNSPISHGFLSDERAEIAGVARNIEAILKQPDNEGQNSYQTLYAEAAPSVFVFRQGRNGKDGQLRKLTGIEHNLSESLEFGVIYSGIPMLSSHVELKAGQTEAKNGALWCANQLGVKISSKHYTDSLKQVLSLENAHFLSRLDDLFDANDSSEIGDFLQYGNELAHSFEKLDGKSEFLNYLWKILITGGFLDRSDIAILPLYSTTKWGSYIWYGRRGIARKNLYEAMKEARKRYLELNIVFDGSAPIGNFRSEVAIEQDRRKNFIAKSSMAEGYLVRGTKGREVVKKYDSLGLSRGKLLVDQITRKIYIDGEKVNSKEILSQQLTIDLLDRFISDGSKEISASDLPSSSYTQNKSEMMSKIISPLTRTIHRRLGRDIRVSCIGSTMDFVIKFEEFDLEVCSVQRIGASAK